MYQVLLWSCIKYSNIIVIIFGWFKNLCENKASTCFFCQWVHDTTDRIDTYERRTKWASTTQIKIWGVMVGPSLLHVSWHGPIYMTKSTRPQTIHASVLSVDFGSALRQPSTMRAPRPYPLGLTLLRIPHTLLSASSTVRPICRLRLLGRPLASASSAIEARLMPVLVLPLPSLILSLLFPDS
jgi:hypothetical protein